MKSVTVKNFLHLSNTKKYKQEQQHWTMTLMLNTIYTSVRDHSGREREKPYFKERFKFSIK